MNRTVLIICVLLGASLGLAATPPGAPAPATAPATALPVVLSAKEKQSPALDPQGNVRADWPGLATQATYEVKDANGKWVKRTWISRRGAGAGTQPAVTPKTYYPANPSDGGSYLSYAGNYFFSTGDTTNILHDCRQGPWDNCFALGAAASVWFARPDYRPSLVSRGSDGEGVDVHWFDYNGNPVIVHTSSDLGSNADRPNPGTGCTGICYIAKSFAYWRYQAAYGASPNTYASTGGGFPAELYELWGFGVKALVPQNATFPTVLRAALAAHKPLTWCSSAIVDGAPLIERHCYVVVGCEWNATMTDATILLYNPWGIDGAGNDGRDDGLVAIKWQSMKIDGGVVAQAEMPAVVPIIGDANGDGVVSPLDYRIWFTHIGPAANFPGADPASIGNWKADDFVDFLDFDLYYSAWQAGGGQP